MTTIGSLFTGYSGLDMAVEQVFGAHTVWTCDIDPGACKIIAHWMPHAPNLGDITKVDWAGVEPVDILTGGWPCQPFSHAGKRLGAADERALWPYVACAVRALRPRHVVLENVAAIASAGELARATAGLAALGYVGSWRCLRAADVGAPHGRARIFIFATDVATTPDADGIRWDGRWLSDQSDLGKRSEGNRRWRDIPTEGCGRVAADAEGNGRHEGRPEPARLVGGPDAAQRGDAAANPDSDGLQGVGRLKPVGCDPDGRGGADVAWGAYEPAIRRWERVLGRPAPAPTETSPRGTQRLSPAFVEWMMGLPAGWVTEVPGLGRNAQLKALGNGVVPPQAAAALRLMLDQLTAVA